MISLLLCLSVLARCGVGGYWLWRLRTAQHLAATSAVHQELDVLARSFGIAGMIRVRTSQQVSSPCVSWLSRGTIYVPDDFEQWTAEERTTALAHELGHEVRRDSQFRFLAELCLSLVCYHPLMLWLRRQLIFAQELATDQHAARVLGNMSQYRRGLSLLALRMDSQRTARYLLSVSTHDVIRRIKMLSSKEWLLSRRQELVAVGAFFFLCTLAAAWTANADDPIRVASRDRLPDPTSNSDAVARTVLPWNELGEQDGYAVVQPGVLLHHPDLKLFCETYFARIRQGIDLSAFGLSPESVELIQTSLSIKILKLSVEEQSKHDGHEHSFAFGADAIVVHTTDAITWKKFGETVAATIPHMLGTEEQLQFLISELAQFDQQSVMRLISKEARGRTSEHTQQLRAVWGQVSNCALAVASAIPDDVESLFGDGV